MNALKLVHVLSAAVSISGFVARGLWMLRDSPRLRRRWVRIAPHINDSVLFLTGVWLVIATEQYPPGQSWLAVKLAAVVLYILLGMAALRRSRRRATRVAAWLAALAVFAYVVAVAVTRSPGLGWQ